MIIFFYGQDTYRLRQKLNQLKEKFISASLGDTNLAVLDGVSISYDEFIRQILAMPFLAKTRLVIIENLLKNGKKDVLEKVPDTLAKVPSSTVLVFVEEGMPDKRTALYKKLNKPETSQEFKLLDEKQLRRWIKKEVEKRGGNIDLEAISKLMEYVGNDLWRQSNELDKLLAFQKNITDENIELLINPRIEANIFYLIDNIAHKNIKGAARELYKLLNSGQNELYILTMIVWQYRNLLIVKDLSVRIKSTNSWVLAKKAGISPFVVQKCVGISSRYSLEELKKAYRTLSDFDIKIKTGKIEPRVALELLIFRLSKEG